MTLAPLPPSGTRPTKRSPIGLILALALLVRLLHLSFVADTPVFSYHRTFVESDMYIFDQWAHRIRDGDLLGRQPFHFAAKWQLASAPMEKWDRWFGQEPTFYKAPFYPYLIALLRWCFDDPALPMALLQIGASVVAVALLFRITEPLFGETAGAMAALLLALYGPAIHFDVIMLRGPWIVLLSLLITWRLQKLEARPGLASAVLLGLAAGALVLVNEGSVPVLLLTAALITVWFRDLRRLGLLLGGLLLGAAIVLAPVVVRNVLVGAPPFKLAITGSFIIAISNSASSNPYFSEFQPRTFVPVMEASGGDLLPTVVACLRTFSGPSDLLLFYLRKSVGLLIPFENPDNVNYYYVALRTPILGILPAYGLLLPLALLGLAIAGRRLGIMAALLPPVLSLLLSMMLTLPLSRYRVPFAVFLMPLAGLALARAVEWERARRLARVAIALAAGFGISVAAGALQTHVAFAGSPPGVYFYRATEFFLGASYYESQGRLAEATREVLDLARLSPGRSTKVSALLMVGRLQARSGNQAAAREALTGASLLGGRDPGLLVAIGDAYAEALRDSPRALAAYREAAELAAPEALRKEIRERLRLLEVGGGVR